MTTICLFYLTKARAPKRRAGWYWDDAEDHGGHDRISPMGPFGDFDATKQDALDNLGAATVTAFSDTIPAHYPTEGRVA